MMASGLLLLVLYTVAIMSVAAWGAGLCLWPLVKVARSKKGRSLSSSFWFCFGMAPILAGLAVGCAPLLSAVLKGLSVISDHCAVHPGHPHFCWRHAETLLPQGLFFWGVSIGGTALFLISLARVGHSVLAMRRDLRHAKSGSTEDGFFIIPSRTPAAFVAGILRPSIYLTDSARRLLSAGERRIVAMHEQEHARRRDPLKLTLLRIAAALFPGFGPLEERWKASVEIECDWACVGQGVDAKEVALTILKMARALGARSSTPALAYASGSERALKDRIERLLSRTPPRRSWIGWGVPALVISVLAAVGLSISHHVLETVLGAFIG